jgi:diguanylate cyclase (GGDEF)-like protein
VTESQDARTRDGGRADIARAVVAAWLDASPTDLASVDDELVERIAQRVLSLPEGPARTDASATGVVLGDLLRELHRRATTDALTGVLTRGAIEQRLNAELRRAERYGRHMSLLLVDVDDLKVVNDAHGHPAGDAVLRALARELDRSIRSTDILGRWGGDEFVVICPEANETAALAVASKIVSVAGSIGVRRNGVNVTSTVSVGWVNAPGGGPPDVVVGRADAALYQAKVEGGGRAVGYGPDLPQLRARARSTKGRRASG